MQKYILQILKTLAVFQQFHRSSHPHDTAGHQTGGGRDGGVPLREDVQGGGHREEPQRHAGDSQEGRGSEYEEALHY